MPVPRGKKDFPTSDSKTLDFPDDWPPTTTICGKFKDDDDDPDDCPNAPKTS